ncbi:hypothetical protein BS47DRAFT_1362110 [Hydnum rufescens UP504]|uniref:Uncharacterized protein n=1 Tax=Hydnum rufescens UP504 TaxID=1448309 RepID=A0A9P6AXV9_9AGAM|nr:hypothetical protein BS47DRAFT_1362110 [Hydnum rufescens UP504]
MRNVGRLWTRSHYSITLSKSPYVDEGLWISVPPADRNLPSMSGAFPSTMMFTGKTPVPKVLSQPERIQIVQYFLNLPPNQRNKTKHFNFNLPERPALLVKYGDQDLLAEASTQSFFQALAREGRSAPGPPAVYNAFCWNGYYFIVMEKVDLPTLAACDSIRDDDAVQLVASAVGWLLAQMPAVPDSLFGRISTSEACLARLLQRSGRTGTLRQLRSPRQDSFLLDATGRIWIVDFRYIGVFPKPYQQYAFLNIGSSFARAVGRSLGHQPPDIAEAMAQASAVLRQTADIDLGLDKFGAVHSTK